MPVIYVVHFRVMLFLSLCSSSVWAQLPTIHSVPLPAGSIGGVTSMTQDIHGYMWFTTSSGLHRYDGYHYTSYTHNALDTNSIAPNAGEAICADRNGYIWVATNWGLDKLDPATGKATHFRYGVTAILEDKGGNIWVGNKEGLLKLHAQTGKTTRYSHTPADSTTLTNGQVSTIYEDRQGTLWYSHQPHKPDGLSHNTVTALYRDRQGVLWAGTEEGINYFDPATESFIRYKPRVKSSFDKSGISSFCEDRQGRFWIATYNGLRKLDRHRGTFTDYFKNRELAYVAEDQSGYLWVGMYRGELYRMDPSTGSTEQYLPGASISTLLFDSQGIMWVGTTSGVYCSNASLSKFSLFTNATHVSETIVVNGMLEDNEGNIWINTTTGLLRLNKQRQQIAILGSERGIKSELIWASQCQYFKSKNGELLMGDRTGKGYYVFSPKQFQVNPVAPQVVINQFLLADKMIKPDSDGPLRKALSQTKEIHLPYNQNTFSFTFAGIHYSSPQANQHLFILENADNNWRKPGGEKQAYYYNVPPGEYLFRVRASSSDGLWAEKQIAVIIHPPPWRTLWAYSFYGLCLLGALFTAGAFQRRRLIRKEQEKARQRELEQAKEIEQAYYQLEQKSTQLAQQKEELESTLDYLKTTQIQLIEQEKAALENELKVERLTKEQALATYQSRMSELEMQALRAQMNPHFIFNCLNSIDRFILKNESEAASDYLTKFSRLIRLILQNSQSRLVPLENELQALKLYIEMEMLRFDGKFSYELIIDPYLDVEEIDVAPLLIQPYVENAIWHGLMHKQGHGHLSIELQMNGERLHCQITDDGVGRKRSNELKSKSAHKGKSLGMQITAHRLELINALQEKVTTVEILDLVDATGEACGTKVLLNIPI